ncbi:phosphate acyltransferase PlsX [Myxococcus sp. CA051A]|uniref:Phosphate acyltransferase n=1 Tax=Myxococcus llanfairpwllgwyngyllgogerychwyrndrobwllllantysiliogogogochensis TaxID=2590453 RepID=A0A540WY58_9BACT|nr:MULTISPECIES: phosphate acyltransferase PlsX [Myxococcus]NTX08478.1 phosphate acyltransferase PlsX [Myxococcus sp. CA040A]NTX16753.1 phosphate acyltransferase PlsX [Myxococcus sp. CA056]NTX41213.1 phosphate acyltransferase PlsX [Myxococcus sp. CA033]NTX66981.1 phosphate acyltransferase PlsX [Myxococcus sp. CA051A]TQF13947.1 phosphate acyltransferase PlsX [Myxococcus llanfairpwllgwyngyllgogerychwyrndrobwllllantysiliogogogochensis]
MRLVLDAMGGDHAPGAPVEGGVLFARAHPEHEVVLVGDTARVTPHLGRGLPPPNLRVHHASEVVEMDDHASTAFRRKRDSSLRVGFELVRDGHGDALVSAGNSGAVMAGGLMTLGRLPGVERPAIAALFPALKGGGRCLLLDAGANVDCRPSHLAQFAVLGEAYVRLLLGVARPRVAVLSNGEEASKGTLLTREASDLLRQSDLDFGGYVEGKDLFSGDVQVVVTDGFTGNVVLKTSEGVGMGVIGMLRQAIEKRGGLSEKLGALLLQPALKGLRKMVDYAEYGGAPLLGLRGVGIVAHGRSSPRAIHNALGAALATAQGGLQEELTRCIARAAAWLPTHPRGKRGTEEAVSD